MTFEVTHTSNILWRHPKEKVWHRDYYAVRGKATQWLTNCGRKMTEDWDYNDEDYVKDKGWPICQECEEK